MYRTGYSKSRKTGKSNYTSANGGYTNIRPSHYFISIPRNSVSYKNSEVPQNESVIVTKKTNNYMISSKEQSQYEQELTRYDSKLKTWSKNEVPVVPSERRKEVQDVSKNIKEYQNLKRAIMFQNRRNKFANNRWRDSINNVINSTEGELNNTNNISQRSLAFLKFEHKNKEMMKKLAVADNLYWTRKRKCKSKSYIDTFARVQKVKSDQMQPLTLRDTQF